MRGVRYHLDTHLDLLATRLMQHPEDHSAVLEILMDLIVQAKTPDETEYISNRADVILVGNGFRAISRDLAPYLRPTLSNRDRNSTDGDTG